MMRPEEFSLQLSWSPRVNGIPVTVPGFYLRAMYANEGEAEGVVKGTWYQGCGGNGSLVGRSFLGDLAKLLYEHDLLEPDLYGSVGTTLGVHLANGAERAQADALAAKRARLEALRLEVEVLEAEVG